ncbi:DUF3558 domain-containing protein [Nocardia sp. NPDC024068]|uniref:DUF3558 domain-containing protein n=1 Tax=Nocardia sp. NPDC024068 TaxID=3157197 RepID=UPI0033EAD218
MSGAVVMVGLVTGCGVTVDGEAGESSSPTSDEQHVQWNPCSELPEEALLATGADPASKDADFDAPGDRATYRMCSWDSVDAPYFIGVGATTLTQEQVRGNTTVTGFTPVQVGDRSGLTFYPSSGERPIRRCYVSLPMQNGMLNVYVDWRYGEHDSMPESPPCGLAVNHTLNLEPYLPK